jgi:hypothetical protein
MFLFAFSRTSIGAEVSQTATSGRGQFAPSGVNACGGLRGIPRSGFDTGVVSLFDRRRWPQV